MGQNREIDPALGQVKISREQLAAIIDYVFFLVQTGVVEVAAPSAVAEKTTEEIEKMDQKALRRTMFSFKNLKEFGVEIELFGPNPYKYGDEGVLEVDGLGGLGQAITAVGGFARNTGKSDGDVAIDALRDEASRDGTSGKKEFVPKALDDKKKEYEKIDSPLTQLRISHEQLAAIVRYIFHLIKTGIVKIATPSTAAEKTTEEIEKMNQEALWRTMHSFDYLMEERGVGIKLFGPNPYKYGDEGVLEVDGLGGLGQAITAVGGFARNTGKSDGDVAIDALRDEASRARKMLVPKASASGGRSDKEG